jgi:hypothetical protein
MLATRQYRTQPPLGANKDDCREEVGKPLAPLIADGGAHEIGRLQVHA